MLIVGAAAFSATAETSIDSKDLKKPAAEYSTAILQGLNKVTGHTLKIDGTIGTVLRFGNLEIIVHRCWKSAPEDRPENAALLEISELRPSEAPKRIFLGWMFSSSPGLSGLEHPVYDVNVLSCETQQDAEPEEKTDTPTTPATTKKKTGKQ